MGAADRMQERRPNSRSTLIVMLVLALIVASAVYWWLLPRSTGTSVTGLVSTNRSNSGDGNHFRAGFAMDPARAGAAAADGCGSNDALALDPRNPAMDGKLAARVQIAKQQMQAALIASADVRQQALGLFLQNRAFEFPPTSDNVAALNALAGKAASSMDPGVYAIALKACRESAANARGSECEELSASGWAQIDSDNLVPWLMVASEAGQRQDADAETEAMHQAAVASHLESYTDTLVAEAVPAIPPGLTLLEQLYVYGDLMALQGAISFPYGPRALRDCSAAGSSDVAVLKDCGAVAEHMVSGGQTLLDLVVGTQLGEMAGWPKGRVAALKRERTVLTALEQNGTRRFYVMDSCHGAVQAMERQRQWFALSEVAALRAELETTGLTVDELLAQYNEGKARALSKGRAEAMRAPH